MAYAQLTDCSWGDIPAPPNAAEWLARGGDEIDSYIGFVYATPVSLSEAIAEQRPGALLLKRINAFLCMGRAILATAVGNSDDHLHKLGEYYVTEAIKALEAIRNGQIVLVGAAPVAETDDQRTGPMVYERDTEGSLVDAFDTAFGNPAKTVLAINRDCPTAYPYYRG